MAYLLAIDQGTTSSRAIVFDSQGTPVRIAQKEFEQIYPRPGWVEHSAEEIWSSQVSVVVEALAGMHLAAEKVAGIGITNQRETTVVWERETGKPICNAIVWQDRRTAALCDRLKKDGVEPTVQERTGLLLDPYFSGSKLQWILENVPGARAKAESGKLVFGTVDSLVIWNLTGGKVHATDPSNASRTLLFNIHSGDWDDEMLKLFRVPRNMLPEVMPSSGTFGHTEPGGLGGAMTIAGVAGDQQAALFGQACFATGLSKNTYGTGCFMLMNTGEQPVSSSHKLLSTVAWKYKGKTEYALEGSVFIGGAVVQWLRDGLKLVRTAAEVEELALTEKDNGGVYLVPAFAGLGAPHWDPYARGAMVGITRGVTAGHLARAALESIAYQVADLVEAMQADSGIELQELRVDGGASRNDLLMQFQADILQRPVVRAEITETTALGAAYLAGLATGVFQNRLEIASHWRAGKRFEPRMPAAQSAELIHHWRRAADRSKGWIES